MHDARLTGFADDLATLGHHLEGVDAVEPGAGNVGAVGILVRQVPRHSRRCSTPCS